MCIRDSPIALSIISPGTTSARSLKSSTILLSISLAEKASTEIAKSWIDSSFLVAVTTTSSISWETIFVEKTKEKHAHRLNVSFKKLVGR